MAELAAAASVIGISTPAFQGVKSAYDFIVGMREAPSNVKRIASELKGLQAVLKSIPTQDDAVPIVRTISREMNLEAAIRTCDKACLEFKGKLEQWMPNPDHPPVFECTRVQFHRTTVRTCRNVVRDTKGVIALAEVIAVKRLQVETLRRQGMVSDGVAALLYKGGTSQALATRAKAEEIARRDAERDEEDERNAVGHDPMEMDVARGVLTGAQTLSASSIQDFDDMIKKASLKAIQLSESVVEQRFGRLAMVDNNDFKQGIAGKVDGKVSQIFGDVKSGSGNKVHQESTKRQGPCLYHIELSGSYLSYGATASTLRVRFMLVPQ